ncbi:MAG: hypothetical protein PWP06_1760 [Candidatus Marinimicrobia bacterium]|jgi:hypothetical protein|nr:hypothetical protein [Candidatus Neomarinimicrobiota bacterium]
MDIIPIRLIVGIYGMTGLQGIITTILTTMITGIITGTGIITTTGITGTGTGTGIIRPYQEADYQKMMEMTKNLEDER